MLNWKGRGYKTILDVLLVSAQESLNSFAVTPVVGILIKVAIGEIRQRFVGSYLPFGKTHSNASCHITNIWLVFRQVFLTALLFLYPKFIGLPIFLIITYLIESGFQLSTC